MDKIRISIDLDEDLFKKYELIAKREYSDKSKLLRKWISQNYKDEYSQEEGDLPIE